MLTTPARFEEREWLGIGVFSAVTMGAIAWLDEPVYTKSKTISPSSYNLLAAQGHFYDSVDPSIFAYGGTALMVGTGSLLKNRKLARTEWTAAEAISFTQLATGFFKTAF